MFEDNNSFFDLIQLYASRILGNTRVRIVIFFITFLTGVLSIGYGLSSLVSSGDVESTPCIVQAPDSYLLAQTARNREGDGSIYIDVSGAVNNPGIYKVNPGERVAKALELAGGVVTTGSDYQKADLVFVSKQLNLSKLVSDGDKIYVPFADEVNEEKSNSQTSSIPNSTELENGSGSKTKESGKNIQTKISINNASKEELMELSGVGEKRADEIVLNRPYSSIDEVVEKGVLSKTVFDKILVELML